jgi:hypothetical protein
MAIGFEDFNYGFYHFGNSFVKMLIAENLNDTAQTMTVCL